MRFQDSESDDSQCYDISYATATAQEVESYIENNRDALLSGETTGVVFVPD